MRIDSWSVAGLKISQSDDLNKDGDTCELASRRRQAMTMIILKMDSIIIFFHYGRFKGKD